MAIFSATSNANLGRYKTFAAEYYQPEFLNAAEQIQKISQQSTSLALCTQ
jgi:hypothetical protein